MEAGGVKPGDLNPLEAREYAEYRYRRLIPMTDEEYLREPIGKVEWTIRIDDVERQIKARRERREAALNKH